MRVKGSMLWLGGWILGCAVMAGCAAELRPAEQGDDADELLQQEAGDRSAQAGATRITQVPAFSESSWTYFHFGSGEVVTPAEPANSQAWDIAFQRFKVISNGGVSGSGGVEVARLDGVDFDGVVEAPTQGYVADAVAAVDAEESRVDSALSGEDPWYSYDFANHVLEPKDVVYVVRGVDGVPFKMQMLGYYDAAGTSGYPRFQWAPLTALP